MVMVFLAILATLAIGFYLLRMDENKPTFLDDEHHSQLCILCVIVAGLLYAIITGL